MVWSYVIISIAELKAKAIITAYHNTIYALHEIIAEHIHVTGASWTTDTPCGQYQPAVQDL